MAGNSTGSVPGQVNSAGELVLQLVSGPLSVIDRLAPTATKWVYSRATQLVIDSTVVMIALYSAYRIRFDGTLPSPYRSQVLMVLPFAVLLHLAINLFSEDYKRTWRFFGVRDAVAIGHSVFVAFVVSVLWRVADPGVFAGTPVPFGVLIIYPVLTYAALVAVRVARRVVYDRSNARKTTDGHRPLKRVLLIGAGEAGLHLLYELRNSDFKVVGFLDDDPALRDRTVGGWEVLGTTEELESIVRTRRVEEVVLCMPSAPKAVLQRIVLRCAKLSVKIKSVPTLGEIMSGTVAIGALRPVKMEDLLGRHSVSHTQDLEELTRAYTGQRILVTGAGGSIGSELVRQLRRFQPSELILLDKDENNLYEVACEIKEDFDHVVEVIADVRNLELLEKLFKLHKPDVVFHAAAYKHVPLMEHYPNEAILNNVMGTRHVADVSNRSGVKIFVLISTDKAVNPSSTMGASKRVAEMIVQQLASTNTGTRFCCVRFGNVLGSRASVVPMFQRQIRQGKNITVTHPDVCRYFMTIPEAVQLVIQAGSLGNRGEIFLLDMGDPVKIVDLAKNLIELSGLVPGKDVTIEFTGLRPGEKLREELLNAGERGARSTEYSKIFVVEAPEADWQSLEHSVRDLEHAARLGDIGQIRQRLRALNIGYHKAVHTREAEQGQTSNLIGSVRTV